MRLASNVNVARTAPSETREMCWIQRQFRGEIKPSKHLFSPPSRSDLPLCNETKSEGFKLRPNLISFHSHMVRRTEMP